MAAEEKPPVEVEPEETAPVQAPQGWQDHNVPVEPDPYLNYGPGDTLERVLQTEMVVDVGRGALTFRSGDKVFVQDGSVVKAETTEGITYEFTQGREAEAERRAKDLEAQELHQNRSAQASQTQQPPDKGPERDEEGHPLHPHGGPPGQEDKEDKQPREKGKFVKKENAS